MKGIKIHVFLLLILVIILIPMMAKATIFEGSLSTDTLPVGIIATDGWSTGVTLSWRVDNESNPGYWTYNYTFTSAQKEISHLIIEVSPNFTGSDVFSATGGYEIDTYYNQGNSNPYIPGPIYGIKWNTSGSLTANLQLVTLKDPVWGDFYAKDGTDKGIFATAWNEGFLAPDPLNPPSNGSINNHILRPDTTTPPPIPEPGTLILLGSGLVGIAGYGVFKRKKRT